MKRLALQLLVASTLLLGLEMASGCGGTMSGGEYYGPGYGYGGYGYVYSPYYYDGTAPPGQTYRGFNGYPY